MRFDWLAKANHFLQTLAFCLAASAIQHAFRPERDYETPLVYSLTIGTSIWLLIDFGRELFPSSARTGWPQGRARWLLPLAGVVSGYPIGTLAGDAPFPALVFVTAYERYAVTAFEAHVVDYLLKPLQSERLRRTVTRLQQLPDPQQFWQVHRSHVVQASAIDTVTRDETGKLWLALRGRAGRIAVSRLHAQRFKAM